MKDDPSYNKNISGELKQIVKELGTKNIFVKSSISCHTAYYSKLFNHEIASSQVMLFPKYAWQISQAHDVNQLWNQVGGEKMYDKARKGETVELSPRRISIYQFDIERSLEDRYYIPLFLTLNS